MPDPVSKEHLSHNQRSVDKTDGEKILADFVSNGKVIIGLYNAMTAFLPVNFSYTYPCERSGAEHDVFALRWHEFTLQQVRYRKLLEMSYNQRYAQLRTLGGLDIDGAAGLIAAPISGATRYSVFRKQAQAEPVVFVRTAEKAVMEHTHKNKLTLLEWDLLVMMLFGYIPSEEELGRDRLRALATVDVIYNLWRYMRFTQDVFRVRIQPQNDAQLETIMGMNLVILQKLSTLEDPSETIKTAIAQRRKSLFNEERTLRRRALRRRVFLDAKDVSDIAPEVQ